MKFPMLFVFVSLVWNAGAAAGELTRSRAELQSLENRIRDLQSTLNSNLENEKSVTSALDQIEFELSGLRREISSLETRGEAIKRSLDQLLVESESLEQQNTDAQKRLGGLLKSRYLLGNQSALRMFISQQDPHKAARKLTMFDYVVKARNRQLEQIEALQIAIAGNRVRTRTEQQALDNALASLADSESRWRAKEDSRKKELGKVRKALAEDKSTMAGYQQRQQSLEKLIRELSRPRVPKTVAAKPAARNEKPSQPVERASQQKPEQNTVAEVEGKVAGAADNGAAKSVGADTTPSSSPQPQQITLAGFGKARGKLPRPLSAEVKVRFGDKRQESGMRWDGVLFKAREGQQVKAIFPGQVVFSDWFRGYGQLMVVDHGEGYMSLYGHNRALNAAVGDQVRPGQTIAMASDESEIPLPGLYFEIRHNGNPDDPLKWVK